MLLILACAKGIDCIKSSKQETIYTIFFYWVLFGFFDFFLNIVFNPLGLSWLTFITNILFVGAYVMIYMYEVSNDSKDLKECDTGSSTGPKLLKNHALI